MSEPLDAAWSELWAELGPTGSPSQAWAVIQRRRPFIEAAARAETAGLLDALEPPAPSGHPNSDALEWYREGWYAHESSVRAALAEADRG